MNKLLVTFSLLILYNNVCEAQIKSPCVKLHSQAIDSLGNYYGHPTRMESLHAALRLVDKAIECDSTQFGAWETKLYVLSELQDFESAIKVTDQFYTTFKPDSSYLERRAVLLENLDLYDSARNLYKNLNKYFGRLLKNDPENAELIYYFLFTKYKISGWGAVKSEIAGYKKKYPNKTHLHFRLNSIHP